MTISGRRAFEIIGLNKRGIKPDSLIEEAHRSEPKKPVDLLEQESLTRFDRSRKGKSGGDGNGNENSNNSRNKRKKKSGNGRPQGGEQGAPQSNNQREQSSKTGNRDRNKTGKYPNKVNSNKANVNNGTITTVVRPVNNKPKPQGERPAQNDKPAQE